MHEVIAPESCRCRKTSPRKQQLPVSISTKQDLLSNTISTVPLWTLMGKTMMLGDARGLPLEPHTSLCESERPSLCGRREGKTEEPRTDGKRSLCLSGSARMDEQRAADSGDEGVPAAATFKNANGHGGILPWHRGCCCFWGRKLRQRERTSVAPNYLSLRESAFSGGDLTSPVCAVASSLAGKRLAQTAGDLFSAL